MEDIISVFEDTAEKLGSVVAGFSGSNLNRVPFEGSWTAAQVTDHVLRSQSVFPKLIAGAYSETNRDPLAEKEKIKNIFLDMSNKMKSPDFILPANEPLEKEELIDRIIEKKNEVLTAMEKHDLKRLYLDFVLPGAEAYTGLEWGWFIIYHTQRHINQLEKIYREVSGDNFISAVPAY